MSPIKNSLPFCHPPTVWGQRTLPCSSLTSLTYFGCCQHSLQGIRPVCWVLSNIPDKCQRSYLKSLMYGRWHLEKSFYKSGPPTSALSLMVSKSRVHTFSRTRLHFIILPMTAFWALLVPFGILQ